MAEFNNLSFLSGMQSSDELLAVRAGTPFRATVSDLRQEIGGDIDQAAVVQERQPSGTNAGPFPEGVWVRRTLNFHAGDFGRLDAGRLTLPAGRYLFSGYASSLEGHSTQARFRSLDGRVSWPGLSLWAKHYTAPSHLHGLLSLTQETGFELQHRCQFYPKAGEAIDQAADWRRGYRTNFGEPEVYSSLVFVKL